MDNKQLRTIETNMEVDCLANDDKLKSERRRIGYANGLLDDDPDKYIKKSPMQTLFEKPSNNTNNQPNIFTKKEDNMNKFSENKNTVTVSEKPSVKQLTEEELMQRKLGMLRNLMELAEAGIQLSQNYDINSDYDMMRYEYELHKGIRTKSLGVKWLQNMTLNMCFLMEWGNEKFDPFGMKLNGWTEQMATDIDGYRDVLGELFEKYNAGRSIAPELKFVLMIGTSALQYQLQNAVTSKTSTLNDTLKTNPELAEKLRREAAEARQAKQREAASIVDREHRIAALKAQDVNMLKQNDLETLKRQQDDHTKKKQELDKLKARLMTPSSPSSPPRPKSPIENRIAAQGNMYNNTPTPNNSNNQIHPAVASMMAAKNANMQAQLEKKTTEVHKQQLIALDEQKKAAEMASIIAKQEQINKLKQYKELKSAEQRQSDKKKTNITSSIGLGSLPTDSEKSNKSQSKTGLNISKDLNKFVEKTINDSRVKVTSVLDANDEEVLSISKDKDSKGSKGSNKSGKKSTGSDKSVSVKSTRIVNGKLVQTNLVGISIDA